MNIKRFEGYFSDFFKTEDKFEKIWIHINVYNNTDAFIQNDGQYSPLNNRFMKILANKFDYDHYTSTSSLEAGKVDKICDFCKEIGLEMNDIKKKNSRYITIHGKIYASDIKNLLNDR